MNEVRAALVFLLASMACASDGLNPVGSVIVETDRGPVSGIASGGALAFLGIPYAAPPIGDLRFRPPAPHASWSTPIPSAFGPQCFQIGGGSEDCLTLDVWTPKEIGSGRSVLVWIHGGGNTGGTARDRGTELVEQSGAVLVSIEYRLGPLGFLTHPALAAESDHGVSGNYGILDQIAALEWVQRNIQAFGGDPSKVTIFGASAGAGDVGVLVASPLAHGLFAAAILQSGATIDRSKGEVEGTGVRVAEALGCNSKPDVAGCLRAASPAALTAAIDASTDLAQRMNRPFTPHVDGWILPSSVIDTVTRGAHNHVPVIIGSERFESAVSVPDSITAEEFQTRMDAFADAALAQEIAAQYPASSYASFRDRWIAITSDANYICVGRRLARALARSQSEPVHRYLWTHPPAAHGADVGYVFQQIGTDDPSELELAKTVLDDFVSLASGERDWPAFGTADRTRRFDIPTTMSDGYARDPQCDFWDSTTPARPW